MVLHADYEVVAAQARLFDNCVARGPCFDLDSVGQLFQRLMMRAVHRGESMHRARAMSERLDIFGLGVVVIGNINVQRPAYRDIEDLQSAADSKSRLARRQHRSDRLEFPFIARAIGIDNQRRRRHLLAQKAERDIAASGQQERIHLREIDLMASRVMNREI